MTIEEYAAQLRQIADSLARRPVKRNQIEAVRRRLNGIAKALDAHDPFAPKKAPPDPTVPDLDKALW